MVAVEVATVEIDVEVVVVVDVVVLQSDSIWDRTETRVFSPISAASCTGWALFIGDSLQVSTEPQL